MSKSVMLRPSEVRSIVRLVGECRDLGNDWWAWQRHCLDELLKLTDSELSLSGEVGGVHHLDLTYLSPPVVLGVPGFVADPTRILETNYDHVVVNSASLFVSDYHARWVEEDGIAISNRDLYRDREWRASIDMQTIGEAAGVDASLLCCREIHAAGAGIGLGEVQDVTLMREKGKRAFNGRDCTIVREVVAALTPLMGGPLARFREPSPADLPPRIRQVLTCFLEGDGDKQVAARLGISIHTVNQYAKQIFKHFGVQSRTELLARWIRRGWTTRGLDRPAGG